MSLRLLSMCSGLCVVAMLSVTYFCPTTAAQTTNVTPNKSNAVAFLPYNYDTADPIARFEQTMSTERGQSYPRFIMARSDKHAVQQTWKIEHLVAVTGQAAWLWLVSHGNTTKVSLENYPSTTPGIAEWNARIATLSASYTIIVNSPTTPGYQLYAHEAIGRHHIFMGRAFVPAHPTPDVIYLAACFGQGFAAEYVSNGAMCVLHYNYKIDIPDAATHATTIYARMNGEQGVTSRPLAAAVTGLALGTAGATNITLAPAVLSHSVPPFAQVGTTVSFVLDTECYTSSGKITPGCCGCVYQSTLEELKLGPSVWTSDHEIQADVTSPVHCETGEFYVKLTHVFSAGNSRALDGNTCPIPEECPYSPPTDPVPIVGTGPNHDAYVVDAPNTGVPYYLWCDHVCPPGLGW